PSPLPIPPVVEGEGALNSSVVLAGGRDVHDEPGHVGRVDGFTDRAVPRCRSGGRRALSARGRPPFLRHLAWRRHRRGLRTGAGRAFPWIGGGGTPAASATNGSADPGGLPAGRGRARSPG